MATVRPFRAQRFTSEAGNLADLVAPPYDVLNSEQRNDLAAQSEHNTVWLRLPESEPGDRSQFVKYGRSAARLAAWRDSGAIKLDETPGFYRYVQTFVNPGTGVTQTREALITLLKLEPYENGVVLPHEQTFPKHKEDRLRLLEATRTHLECIYGLYQDATGATAKAVREASGTPIAELTTTDSVCHELHRITDPSVCAAIVAAFEAEKIWIADGHHRYETALTFRGAQGEQDTLVPEDFMMIALSSMKDSGLALLPTHRILSGINLTFDEIESRLRTKFNTRPVANVELPSLVSHLHREDTRVFGFALPGGRGLLVNLENPRDALRWTEGPGSELLKMLDVSIIHEVLLPEVFGITGTDKIAYTRDAEEALAAVGGAADKVSILTNPPTVDEMRRIALGGEKMPQKSTFYYPKLLSGLVFWSLGDFA